MSERMNVVLLVRRDEESFFAEATLTFNDLSMVRTSPVFASEKEAEEALQTMRKEIEEIIFATGGSVNYESFIPETPETLN